MVPHLHLHILLLYKFIFITRKWSTLYKRYVIWECSITTINPNYVNLMFSPHKAHNVLGLRMYICMNMNFYEPYMREWVRTCFVEHHILSHTVEKQAKIEHHQKYNTAITYTRCQMALCFQLIQEKEKIYVSHLKKNYEYHCRGDLHTTSITRWMEASFWRYIYLDFFYQNQHQ